MTNLPRRVRYFRDLKVMTLAMAICSPAPVLPDVMEMSEAGPSWIAGGPRVSPDAPIGPEASAVVRETSQVAAITIPLASAGPVAWNRRVAHLAAKYDLSPALIEAVVWQESRWRHGAVSPAGARGLAQLMPQTARQLGVDPDDPQANLEGGARYLRQQIDAFNGDLERALAAYNAGPGRVRKAGGVPEIRETRDYVAAILSRLSAPVRE